MTSLLVKYKAFHAQLIEQQTSQLNLFPRDLYHGHQAREEGTVWEWGLRTAWDLRMNYYSGTQKGSLDGVNM